jgi:glycosidase
MWGADDPDERKPQVWSDLRYDDETAHPLRLSRRRDRVAPDTALFRVYRDLIALRKEHLRLFVDGGLRWLLTNDARRLLVYERALDNERAIVAFNNSDTQQAVAVGAKGAYRLAWPADGPATNARDSLRATIPARAARVWIRE